MYCEYLANSWTETREMLLRCNGFVFRGQASSTWPLSTTIERPLVSDYHIPEKTRRYTVLEAERQSLQAFKRRVHNYSKELMELETDFEYLAMMQHYGCPTRLIDFTYSPFVGVYFAIENAEGDATVWAVNKNLLREHIDIELFSERVSKSCGNFEDYRFVADNVISYGKNTDFVIHVEPKKLYQRMMNQQGTFLMSCNPVKPFEENLCKTLRMNQADLQHATPKVTKFEEAPSLASVSIIKFLLPFDWHKMILDELELMNVSSATLFPDLPGFAQSVKTWMRNFQGHAIRNAQS